MESEDWESESDNANWDFQEEDYDYQEVQSLFCPRIFSSIDEAMESDSQAFGFDLRRFRKQASPCGPIAYK